MTPNQKSKCKHEAWKTVEGGLVVCFECNEPYPVSQPTEEEFPHAKDCSCKSPHPKDTEWEDFELARWIDHKVAKARQSAFQEVREEIGKMKKTEYEYEHEFPHSMGFQLDGKYHETIKKGEKKKMKHILDEEDVIWNSALSSLDDIIKGKLERD